jgi:hypothetical protein
MNWKTLFAGIALIVLIGTAGFLYRSIMEQPTGVLACPDDARLCPNGTSLGRTGPSCTFPECPPPNIDLTEASITFALPTGYSEIMPPSASMIAAYEKKDPSGLESYIYISKFDLGSSTAADFIRSNAIMDASGMPASPTSFSSVSIGDPQHEHRFSLVNLGRFEGVVMTTYYLSRESDVLRFDAQSRGVVNWTDPTLDVAKLPANQDLRILLGTLQGN